MGGGGIPYASKTPFSNTKLPLIDLKNQNQIQELKALIGF
jgi:hypothetical protein